MGKLVMHDKMKESPSCLDGAVSCGISLDATQHYFPNSLFPDFQTKRSGQPSAAKNREKIR